MLKKEKETAVVAGLHLFNVLLSSGTSLWITTAQKDFELAAKKAKRLTTSKKSEFYGSSILKIEHQGTLDA